MIYSFDGQVPEIAESAYVDETAIVVGNVQIGERCYVGYGAIIRGDYGRIEIGAETAVEEGVIIHAPPDRVAVIGKRVTMGHGAIVHADKISDFAVIGMGAVVSLNTTVGAGSIVAEGAVVKQGQSIPEGVVAGGTPAKVIRTLEKKDFELWTWGKQLYVDLAEKCLKPGMVVRLK